jgi:hypothetical protein
MVFEGVGVENPALPRSLNQNFIGWGAFIHPAHPIQTLFTGMSEDAG